jgi:hypothetical protein
MQKEPPKVNNNKKLGLAVWQHFGIGFGSIITLGLTQLGGLSFLTKNSSSLALPNVISQQTDEDKLHGEWQSSKDGMILAFSPEGKVLFWDSNSKSSKKFAIVARYEINTSIKPYQLDIIDQEKGKEIRSRAIFEFTPNAELQITTTLLREQPRPIKIDPKESRQTSIFHKISNLVQVPADFKILSREQAGQSFINRARESEAKSSLGTVNRAQQAYQLENNHFASSINNLDVKLSLKFYNLRVVKTTKNNSYTVAVPKQSGLRSYSAAVWIQGDNFYQKICESNQPTSVAPGMPQRNGLKFICPAGSSLIE